MEDLNSAIVTQIFGDKDSNTTTLPTLSTMPVVDCEILGLLPLTSFGSFQSNAVTHMAAALLAIQHFNERNGVIVTTGLEDLSNCPVYLPEPSFVNTNARVKELSTAFMNLPNAKDLCVMVGPYHNIPTKAAANFALGLDIPLISHGAYDVEVGGKRAYPNTARTSTQYHSLSELIANFMVKNGRTDYLATVAGIEDDGDQIRKTFAYAVRKFGFTRHDVYNVGPPLGKDQGVDSVLRRIKESGVRNIFISIKLDVHLQFMADSAEHHGLNNGEYFWMIGGEIDLGQLSRMASQNQNVSKLVNGMMSAWFLDGFQYNPEGDSFLKTWRSLNETFVARMNALHPIQDATMPGYFQAPNDYFQTHEPERGAAFMYDAVMSAALGKCKQLERESAFSVVSGEESTGEKNAHLQGIIDLNFTGATGRVEFGAHWHPILDVDFPGNREKQSLTYGVYNIRTPQEGDSNPYNLT